MSENRGNGPPPAGVPERRASDEDRERVISRLREAVGCGALQLDELEERIGAVYAAETMPELDGIAADLPADPRPPAPRPSGLRAVPALRDSGFQAHLTIYVLVIGFLVGIWALSGAGHFWPFYPAAGWGIGLGSHYMGATASVKRRERRRNEIAAGDRGTSIAAPPFPAPPATVPGEGDRRRFVVAMFVDVVGSTELNEALGDESWSRVRDRHRALLSECFDDEGGWEVNVAGDGVLARFAHPAAAVRAAIQIQRRLDRQRTEIGFAPTVRIGIHSGDAVEDGDDLIGSVVNLAARVTSAAEPSEIYVTEHVADHIDGSAVTEGRGLRDLKGVARPRHLLAVRWS